MTRKSKQEQLQAHLEAVKRLRQQVTEEERKTTRKRNDQLATALVEIGLDQLILSLSKAERQRISGLASVVERLRELAKVHKGADPAEHSAEPLLVAQPAEQQPEKLPSLPYGS
jgi:hypothetical protein